MSFRILISSIKRNNIFIHRHFRCNVLQLKKVELKEAAIANPDEPIKFSTSKAAKWRAIDSSSGDYFSTPRIQPVTIVMSLTAFMVYFCILREENDLDDWLREIETTVPIQVEEAQLRVEILNGHKKGIDVSWQQERLNALIEKRTNLVNAS